ncbi:sporulation histidine kinase inhibitor Sda [Lentibacillus amyloliquefaciens]|nr:sporulation histidine kinase inhibitor Sda [Lentibacillus amyloliquefaciens]
MEALSDELLVRAYIKALESNLNPDFVHLLKQEIEQRKLCLDNFNLTSIK